MGHGRMQDVNGQPWTQTAVWGNAGDQWKQSSPVSPVFPLDRNSNTVSSFTAASNRPSSVKSSRAGTFPHHNHFTTTSEVDHRPPTSPSSQTAPHMNSLNGPHFGRNQRTDSQSPSLLPPGAQKGSSSLSSVSSNNVTVASGMPGVPETPYYSSVPGSEAVFPGEEPALPPKGESYFPNHQHRKPSYKSPNNLLAYNAFDANDDGSYATAMPGGYHHPSNQAVDFPTPNIMSFAGMLFFLSRT